MVNSKRGGIVLIFILTIAIFGYSQYASASQMEINITNTKLINEDNYGSNYDIELEFVNPSLLILNAGDTEFFLVTDNQIRGEGTLEPFSLQPLETSYVNGKFYTNSNHKDTSASIKITGTTKYNLLFTDIEIPFVLHPSEEQAREFIDQD